VSNQGRRHHFESGVEKNVASGGRRKFFVCTPVVTIWGYISRKRCYNRISFQVLEPSPFVRTGPVEFHSSGFSCCNFCLLRHFRGHWNHGDFCGPWPPHRHALAQMSQSRLHCALDPIFSNCLPFPSLLF